MPHALAPDLGLGDFNPAFLAHHAAVLESFIFGAQAFIVLDRAEDLGAEQAVALRLEGAIIDRLGLFDLPKRPGTYFFRRGEADGDGIECIGLSLLLQ